MHGGDVKQEQEVEMVEANEGAASPALVEGIVTARIDKDMLHCPLCTLPLKPPIFQCDVGHLACSGCDGLLSGNQCYACSSSGGSYGRNPALEAHLRSIKIQCPYSIYGCHAYVAYCDADDHRSVCPCAPCWCPGWGQGCRFVGSLAMLLDHIAGEHPASSPVVVIRYGRELNLAVTTAERRRRHALVGEDDRSLFLVSLASSPCCSADDITAVSLVCVRANAGGGAAPRYTCRLAVELPSTGTGEEEDGGEVVVMECKVRSSALPGGSPAMDQRSNGVRPGRTRPSVRPRPRWSPRV